MTYRGVVPYLSFGEGKQVGLAPRDPKDRMTPLGRAPRRAAGRRDATRRCHGLDAGSGGLAPDPVGASSEAENIIAKGSLGS